MQRARPDSTLAQCRREAARAPEARAEPIRPIDDDGPRARAPRANQLVDRRVDRRVLAADASQSRGRGCCRRRSHLAHCDSGRPTFASSTTSQSSRLPLRDPPRDGLSDLERRRVLEPCRKRSLARESRSAGRCCDKPGKRAGSRHPTSRGTRSRADPSAGHGQKWLVVGGRTSVDRCRNARAIQHSRRPRRQRPAERSIYGTAPLVDQHQSRPAIWRSGHTARFG